ncbi:hypothetical protein GCM10027577_14640 [Spirosoma fluminis]
MFVLLLYRRFVRFLQLALLLTLVGPLVGRGQGTVLLDQWPARLQLYPRDQANQCSIGIAGRAPTQEVKAVSLVVLRSQQPYRYERVKVDSLTGRFALNPVINSELSEYSFRLFAHRATDSLQIAFRDSIVCGDVFLIMGQSNAVGRFDANAYRNEFCRTFGVNNGEVVYNPADTAWCLTNTSEGANSLWGVELQRLITTHHGIPTAVINGAAGSTSIFNHAARDPDQPATINNLYGRLLYRARKAGVADRAKAMIWRQGEAEAANEPQAYEQTFPRLYGYWKQDYPGLAKVYHAQLNLLVENKIGAGALRDFQRRSKSLFPNNEPIATVGLPGYQGIHYNEIGYRQFGLELYRLIARDFYVTADTSNISSPNVQRIFYSTPEQNEIVLEFEPGQVMRWPADTVILNPANGTRFSQSLSNFVYTDYPYGESSLIKSVTEQGNRLILKLTKSITAKTLTYMPSYYQDREIGYYVGPLIKNRRGMRALTFYQVPIAAPLPVAADLRATPVDTSAIKLIWNEKSEGVEQWLIERADTADAFRQLARVPGSATSYDDQRLTNGNDSLRIGKVYKYRIRSTGSRAEAPYSPVVTASLQLVLSTPALEPLSDEPASNPAALVYPNPARDQVRVRLPIDWNGDSVLLTLTDETGALVLRRTDRPPVGSSTLTFSVSGLPVGSYVLSLQYRNGGVQCRLLVEH